MFRFILKMFIGLLRVWTQVSFGRSLPPNYKKPITYVTLNSRPCQGRPTIVNINSRETLFYQFLIGVNKCGGICNAVDDLYARAFVLNKVKNMNLKVVNVMSGLNKTKFSVQHELC